MYHNTDDKSDFNTLSLEDFESHLSYLRSSNQFTIVNLDEYINNLKSPVYNKTITLTFDDAYSNIKGKVLPLLKKYQIPIIIFVPVHFVGKHNVWDAKKGIKKIGILTWPEIRELNQEKLITFGSHGYSHISLGDADIDCIRFELQESKSILEKELKNDVDYFSYPFGQLKDIGHNSHKLLFESGYKAGLTTNWFRKNSLTNIHKLNRIEIQNFDDLSRFKKILNRKIDYKFFKQQLKNTFYHIGLKR